MRAWQVHDPGEPRDVLAPADGDVAGRIVVTP